MVWKEILELEFPLLCTFGTSPLLRLSDLMPLEGLGMFYLSPLVLWPVMSRFWVGKGGRDVH